MATGFVWDELYMWHDAGTLAGYFSPPNPVQPGTPFESADTKRRFKNLLEVSGLLPQLVMITPRTVTEDELLMVHTKDYVNKVRSLSNADGGDAGVHAHFGKGGYDIAKLAVGGVIAATDAVMTGEVENAYALVRPIGHHAEPDMGQGFCIFNNGAIAGRHALKNLGLERIAYVDWDVHHGNGTQRIFWEDPRSLTISIHQENWLPPGSGNLEDIGEGDGRGYNINIPLPPGSGTGAYAAAFERVVLPALEIYKPQLIFVPSGFDAGVLDPLARMMMHSEGFRNLTKKIKSAAHNLCGGRIVMCHEGGYSESYVPFIGLAVMEELSGIRTGVEDPNMALVENMGGQGLQPHQDARISEAEDLLRHLG
jgi:acetoin utilization deacetylase AcuC-like enzyme